MKQHQMTVFVLNAARNACRVSDEAVRRSEARRFVKLFLVPRGTSFADRSVPDYLITDSMIDRFLEIEPPVLRSTTDFDSIIEEVERTYVLGLYFSAVSASVVIIERMLNTARIDLHKFVSTKLKALWDKGPTNEWQPNIDALVRWKCLTEGLGKELSEVYEIRNRYLHSGDISTARTDALRAVRVAYSLLNELIGFPPRLFRIGATIECLDPDDPLVRVFYKTSEHC